MHWTFSESASIWPTFLSTQEPFHRVEDQFWVLDIVACEIVSVWVTGKIKYILDKKKFNTTGPALYPCGTALDIAGSISQSNAILHPPTMTWHTLVVPCVCSGCGRSRSLDLLRYGKYLMVFPVNGSCFSTGLWSTSFSSSSTCCPWRTESRSTCRVGMVLWWGLGAGVFNTHSTSSL